VAAVTPLFELRKEATVSPQDEHRSERDETAEIPPDGDIDFGLPGGPPDETW
jgi:hypothetical protein